MRASPPMVKGWEVMQALCTQSMGLYRSGGADPSDPVRNGHGSGLNLVAGLLKARWMLARCIPDFLRET